MNNNQNNSLINRARLKMYRNAQKPNQKQDSFNDSGLGTSY